MTIVSPADELPQQTPQDKDTSANDAPCTNVDTGHPAASGDASVQNKLEEHRFEFAHRIHSIDESFWDAGEAVAYALLYSNCRIVRYDQHVFVIHQDDIIHFSDEEEAETFLDHMDLDAGQFYYESMIWGYAHDWLEDAASDVLDLMDEFDVDLADHNPFCDTVQQMKELIASLLADFGPDFFQLEPDERGSFQDAIPPFTGRKYAA